MEEKNLKLGENEKGGKTIFATMTFIDKKEKEMMKENHKHQIEYCIKLLKEATSNGLPETMIESIVLKSLYKAEKNSFIERANRTLAQNRYVEDRKQMDSKEVMEKIFKETGDNILEETNAEEFLMYLRNLQKQKGLTIYEAYSEAVSNLEIKIK